VAVFDFIRRRLLARPRVSTKRSTSASRVGSGSSVAAPPSCSDYPGDFTGIPRIEYTPHPDGLADPGEIVWAWVPFEEDHRQGKDRPILVIGRDHEWLLGTMLTSKDHDRDGAREAYFGRYWMDIGVGAWDRERRPSEVRLDRIIRLRPHGVRREGAALDRKTFERVASGVLAHR
jgi:PemK-like, MazF-like toxin of type II toxin-antitoxin system